MKTTFLVILGLAEVYSVPITETIADVDTEASGIPTSDIPETCGYQSCHPTKPEHLNIHIVPHTHDDVGWLKTVDQYYYGREPGDPITDLDDEFKDHFKNSVPLKRSAMDYHGIKDKLRGILDIPLRLKKTARRNAIQKAGVQYILNSVIEELTQDPNRRFIYVETAFFWKWWVRQSAAKQDLVRNLVRQGRLQFVGGAWSMNDEAAAHYQSTIDQFTWGLSKLNSTFGYCGLPRVGWQIDPFGHSREFASLLAMMGYDGLFLGRIDYQDKLHRLKNKSMEMIWRTSNDLGKSSQIFTGVLHNTYSPPPGFCFDILCNDEPIIDDPESPMNNVDRMIVDFMDICYQYSKAYRTNNVLITMGEDFNYQDAGMWFSNLDKLIETDNVIITMGGDFTYQDASMWYINLDKLIKYTNLVSAKNKLGVYAFYSTPNCYLKAIKDSSPILPIKKDDFFPYASDPNAFWTGYFTSRPTTKFFERQANRYLQMVKQLQVLANLDKHNQFVLNELRSAMGVMQHHDAITGTEKQHVTKDYVRMLNQAINDAFTIAKQALNKLTQKGEVKKLLDYKLCHLNESSCPISETSDRFVVTVYNPLGWSVEEPIRVPIVDGIYGVYAPNGESIPVQMVEIPLPIINLPKRTSKATTEIVFIAKLHPLSYKSYYIIKNKRIARNTDFDYFLNMNDYYDTTKDRGYDSIEITKAYQVPFQAAYQPDDSTKASVERKQERLVHKNIKRRRNFGEIPKLSDDDMRVLNDQPVDSTIPKVENTADLQNYHYKLHYDKSRGVLEYVKLTTDNAKIDFSPNMFYYPAAAGQNQEIEDRASGAYIFRPNATQPTKLKTIKSQIIKGPIVKEFRVHLHPAGYMSTKLYTDLNFIENEFIVGPIPIDDNVGKEYVIKYQTNIFNNGIFYTDSNGRQMIKRKLNFRPEWNLTLQEPVAGNYYPVTNQIFIKNEDIAMSVLTDRSEGGSSLVEGEIELMVHRRLLYDDAFGVGEALNETDKGLGLVVQGKHRIVLTKSTENITKNVFGMHLLPVVVFSDASDLQYEDWLKSQNSYSFLKRELPYGVHLLTVEPWEDKLLIRFENYLEKNTFSNVTLNITNVFKNIIIKSVKETMLAANVWAGEYRKWMWNNQVDQPVESSTGPVITLKAKEIRTFIVDYDYIETDYNGII